MPWEDKDFEYPSNFASPLQIIIEASNGASDYGNKFGEPLITGNINNHFLHSIRDNVNSLLICLFQHFRFCSILRSEEWRQCKGGIC